MRCLGEKASRGEKEPRALRDNHAWGWGMGNDQPLTEEEPLANEEENEEKQHYQTKGEGWLTKSRTEKSLK